MPLLNSVTVRIQGYHKGRSRRILEGNLETKQAFGQLQGFKIEHKHLLRTSSCFSMTGYGCKHIPIGIIFFFQTQKPNLNRNIKKSRNRKSPGANLFLSKEASVLPDDILFSYSLQILTIARNLTTMFSEARISQVNK